jgi:hypothetical protein
LPRHAAMAPSMALSQAITPLRDWGSTILGDSHGNGDAEGCVWDNNGSLNTSTVYMCIINNIYPLVI